MRFRILIPGSAVQDTPKRLEFKNTLSSHSLKVRFTSDIYPRSSFFDLVMYISSESWLVATIVHVNCQKEHPLGQFGGDSDTSVNTEGWAMAQSAVFPSILMSVQCAGQLKGLFSKLLYQKSQKDHDGDL